MYFWACAQSSALFGSGPRWQGWACLKINALIGAQQPPGIDSRVWIRIKPPPKDFGKWYTRGPGEIWDESNFLKMARRWMFLPRAREWEETPSLGREGEIFYGGVVSENERDGLCLSRYESFSFNPHLGSKYKESCRLQGEGRRCWAFWLCCWGRNPCAAEPWSSCVRGWCTGLQCGASGAEGNRTIGIGGCRQNCWVSNWISLLYGKWLKSIFNRFAYLFWLFYIMSLCFWESRKSFLEEWWLKKKKIDCSVKFGFCRFKLCLWDSQ